ncbi:hypothetical protein ABBQ32_011461 [Trebouxia sp. C0010 RCD-2024]
MYAFWRVFVLVLVCSGWASASGRELTGTTAAAPSDPSGQSGLPALTEAVPAAATSTGRQSLTPPTRLSTTSANLTAAAVESEPTLGVMWSPGSASPSPPPPPHAVSNVLSSAAEVPMVTAYHKLGGFSVATFDTNAQNTFTSTLEANILKISGPVKVFIPSGGITDGSVNLKLSVVFLNGHIESATAYKSALTGSSASSVYGSYDAYVDPATFTTETTANPTQGSSGAAHHRLGAVAAFLMVVFVALSS